MILYCRYGVVDGAPEKGFVAESHDEAGAPPASLYPGTVAVPDGGPVERFGRFGPAPAPMGDPPSPNHADHGLLDMLDVPRTVRTADGEAPHPLRALAGTPRAVEDNRAVAIDMRRWAAPDLTVAVARAAAHYALDLAYAAAHDGGFPSEALGAPHRYGSTEAAVAKLQLAAFASLMGQSRPGWTAGVACAPVDRGGVAGAEVVAPHAAAQVHAVVADYQGFLDGLHARRDRLRAAVDAAAAPADALAVAWA